MSRPLLLCLALAAPLLANEETTVALGGGVELTLVRIEPGTFQQGSPETEAGRGTDEAAREVTLTRAFWLGKDPVTRGQFAQFVNETRYRTEAEVGTSGGFGWDGAKLTQRKEFTWRNPGFPQDDDHPVVLVTWPDAQAFLEWLRRKTGGDFALPTEAQWEYAARAGTANVLAPDAAWHLGNAGARTHSASEKPANAWGLRDMAGNAWEWCADWYAPYSPGAATDPVQTNPNLSDKPRRVLRGGSWLKDAATTRAAARFRNDPKSRNADNGFRVMAYRPSAPIERSAPPPAAALERQRATPEQVPPPAIVHEHPTIPPPRVVRTSIWNAVSSVFCCGGIAVLALWLVSKLVKRAQSGGPEPSMSPLPGVPLPPTAPRRDGGPPRTRLVEDGFWLEGGSVAPGTLLTCRYIANGRAQSIEVRYEAKPDGQFIYTGGRPTSVSVAITGAAVGASSTLFDDDDRAERFTREREEDERRRRRRSDPPAY